MVFASMNSPSKMFDRLLMVEEMFFITLLLLLLW